MIEALTIAQINRPKAKSAHRVESWNDLKKKPDKYMLVKLLTDTGKELSGWWTGGSWDGAFGVTHATVVAWSPYLERNYP